MLLEKEQTLFSIILEDTGLIDTVIIPINVSCRMRQIKGIANKNYFYSNGEENYMFKNQI